MDIVSVTSDPVVLFSYSAPTITGLTKISAPTAGGILNVTGTNFGPANQQEVRIADIPCASLTWVSHTLVSCRVTEGQGVNLTVKLIAGGQTAVSSTLYSFDPPAISSITTHFLDAVNSSVSSRCPTGGAVASLNLTGTNFGTDKADPPTQVIFGGFGSPYRYFGQNVLVLSHTLIQCDVPEGLGQNLDIRVVVGNQTSAAAAIKLAYQEPIIQSLDYAPASPAGGSALTINGVNFGVNSSTGVTVARIGSTNCTQTQWKSHERVVCIVPPLTGAGQNLNVSVRVGDQISAWAPAAVFSYANPFVTSISYPEPALTSGNTLLTVNGLQLGSLDFPPIVKIGTSS